MARADVVLDSMDLMLLRQGRGRSVSGTEVPEIAGERFVREDVPLEIDSLHLGGMYSQRIVEGTYDYAQNAWCLNPRVVMPSPMMTNVTLSSADGPPRAAVEEAGDLYIVGGSKAFRIPGGAPASSTIATHKDFDSTTTAVSAVAFEGAGFVGTINSSNEPRTLWKVDGTTWSSNAANRGYLTTTFYSTAAGQSRFLAGQSSKSEIEFATTDPTSTSNWGAAVTIRETGSVQINGLVSRTDHTYIATDRGLFDFDGGTGNTLNLTPEIANLLDDENGLATLSHNGWIYYGHRRGIKRVQTFGDNNGLVQDVTPGYGLPVENPVRGACTALIDWGAWVIAAIYNGTDTYFCFGRDLRAGEPSVGPSPMLWHPGVFYLSGAKCQWLHITGLTTPPRLYGGRGNNVWWAPLPRTENPLQDGDLTFAISWSLFHAAQDWGITNADKDNTQQDFENDGAGTGATLAVYTAQNGGAYGLYGTVRLSPQAPIRPPAPVVGRRIKMRWDGTGTGTAAPIVRGWKGRADVLTPARQRRRYIFKIGEVERDRLGGRGTLDVGTVLRRLRSLPDRPGGVTMRDEFGDSLTVRVHRPVDDEEIEVEGQGTGKVRVQAAALEVSVLTRSVSGQDILYDAGNKYDAGHIYA